jgi:hypothetical protein
VKFGRLIRYRVLDIQTFLERKLIGNNTQANGRQGLRKSRVFQATNSQEIETMASISTDKSRKRRILYFDENRKRRVFYIGKVSDRNAEGVQRPVESMLAARILGNAIDRDDARWLSESPTIREKLERLDLIPSGKIQIDRRCMSMEEFLDEYIERHVASRKPATVAVWKQVVANLKEFMPEGIRINQITAGHAKEFHEKLKARGMATTTIHKRIQFARQFMHDAVDWKIID